jgi:hypothetical protein
MVLSSASLSLGFPLDMRAAIENAFAREESCGFGDDVYSMVGTRGTNSLQNPKAPNRTYMRFSSAKILADTEKEKNNFAGLFLVFPLSAGFVSCEDFNDFNRSLSPESQLNKGEEGKGPRSIIEMKQLYMRI